MPYGLAMMISELTLLCLCYCRLPKSSPLAGCLGHDRPSSPSLQRWYTQSVNDTCPMSIRGAMGWIGIQLIEAPCKAVFFASRLSDVCLSLGTSIPTGTAKSSASGSFRSNTLALSCNTTRKVSYHLRQVCYSRRICFNWQNSIMSWQKVIQRPSPSYQSPFSSCNLTGALARPLAILLGPGKQSCQRCRTEA